MKDTDLYEHVLSWDKIYEHTLYMECVYLTTSYLENAEDKFSA